jgi:hypothetical protein
MVPARASFPRWPVVACVSALFYGLCVAAAAMAAESAPSSPLPAAWMASWNNPPLADRPLQIVHGIDLEQPSTDASDQAADAHLRTAALRKIGEYKDLGLGGIVCNVAFQDYMVSEANWRKLIAGVEACEELGMVVWLYDEEGYPSGAAGGLVLKANPAFEALALAYDPSRPDPLFLRPAYEHTHASNNFYAARRYINVIDDRAVGAFIAATHDAYDRRLGRHFGKTIQAFFTDEPSLIAVNLGQLPDEVRTKVRVADPIDPAVRPLPTVPWSHDLAELYRKRYGEDLHAHRKSLFSGERAEDRRLRSQFWELIADLVAERYFGAIQRWCQAHHVASSGHTLWEEELMHHPALDGNKLKALARMDIPGLDLLTSDPEAVIHSGWITAGLPASAAALSGARRVMTEVSDFAQTMGRQGPAKLPEMQATAAWQAAWGVTDFTLYYRIRERSADEYRAYNAYVGRLNALLKPARPVSEVLLYYPVRDLWAEYLPVAEPLRLSSQSVRAQRIVRSFVRIGQILQRNQVPFLMIDHEHLASAKPQDDGSLRIGPQRFTTLLLPADVELPPAAVQVVDQFRKHGGKVLADDRRSEATSREGLLTAIQPAVRLSPSSDRIVLGSFVRDQRRILLLVNVGRHPYQGQVAVAPAGSWHRLNPADGSVCPAEKADGDRLRLELAPRQAVLLVESP